MAEEVDNLILQNKEDIVAKVKEQWQKGLRPDGSIIGEYKSFVYMQEKLSRNPLARGNVDLIDTGALSEGLTINKLMQSVFTIFSTDEKAVMIANKYGLDVYGLNEEEKKMFIENAMVMAIEQITNKIYA